jgi:glutathione S-transferase
MAEDLVLYTNPQSRGAIARWMLEEVGAPYRAEVLGFGPPMKGDYRAINPMGKVPALVHRGTVVTECAAICAYLADVFPEAGLAPPPGARAAYYRWLFFAAGPAEAAVTNRVLGVELNDKQRGFVGYGSYRAVMDALETAVAGPFIAGDGFTAADVYVGSFIGWGMQVGTVEPRPAFQAYWDRIKDRPARARAAALDQAALAAAS